MQAAHEDHARCNVLRECHETLETFHKRWKWVHIVTCAVSVCELGEVIYTVTG